MMLKRSVKLPTYPTQVAFDYFCREFEDRLYIIFGLRETVDPEESIDGSPKKMLHSAVIAMANIIYLSHQFEEMGN